MERNSEVTPEEIERRRKNRIARRVAMIKGGRKDLIDDWLSLYQGDVEDMRKRINWCLNNK